MSPVRRHIAVLAAALLGLALGAGPAAAAPPPPNAPTGLRTAAVTATSVGLAWNAVSGATGYQVLRGTPTTALTVVGTTTDATYTDTGRTPGATYTYAVATVTKKGTSAPSATVTVTTVPAAPASLTATATSTTTAVLGWSAAAGTTSYQVWRATGTGPLQLRTTVAADALSFTDTGLAPGTTYRWTVRASNAYGTSGDSPTATATTPAPPKATPTVTVTSSANPSQVGDRVVFTVRVASATSGTAIPTGSVSLRLQGSVIPSVLTASGVATFDWIFNNPGDVAVTAAYDGDSRFNAANGSVVQSVHQASGLGGSVAYPTGSWPSSVVAADVNGDGHDEAVVSTTFYFDPANDYSLFVHDLTTDPPTVTKLPTGGGYTDKAQLGAGDLDGDGTDDVVLGGDGALRVFLGSPQGLRPALVTSTDGAVWDVVVAELTGDSHLDVLAAVKSPTGAVAEVFAGNGDGTFDTGVDVVAPRASDSPPALAVGDVDANGQPDVVLLWRSSREVDAVVDYGLKAGTAPGSWDYWSLATLTGSQWPEAVAVGDVTGDGRPDAVVTAGGNSPSSQLVVVPTGANGRWGTQYAVGSYDVPEPVVVADLDRDGHADVVTAHGGWNRVGVYRQLATGGLAAEQLYEVPYASHYPHRALAVGDVTGDGQPDVLLADYNSGLVVLPGVCSAYCGT